MDQCSNSKAALNIWAAKKKLKIDYNIKTVNENPKKQAFQCEIKIQSIDTIVGHGEGLNKKTAADTAALKALKFLIEHQYLRANDLSKQLLDQIGRYEISKTENNRNNNDNRFNGSKPTKTTSRYYLENNNGGQPRSSSSAKNNSGPPVPNYWEDSPLPSNIKVNGPPSPGFNQYPPLDHPPPENWDQEFHDNQPHPGPPHFHDNQPHPGPPHFHDNQPHPGPPHFHDGPPHPGPPHFHDGPPHPGPPHFHDGPPHPGPPHFHDNQPHPGPPHFHDQPPHPGPPHFHDQPPHPGPPHFHDQPPPSPRFFNGPPPPPPPRQNPRFFNNQPHNLGPPPQPPGRYPPFDGRPRFDNAYNCRPPVGYDMPAPPLEWRRPRWNGPPPPREFNKYDNNRNRNNDYYHHDHRNRKLPNNSNQMKDCENNVDHRMKNLRINETPKSVSSAEEESVVNMLKEAKKRKFDSNTIRNQLKTIENECKFTLDIAKQQLHIFMQMHKIHADYEIKASGPHHSQTFVAKLKFFVPHNRKEYHAEETGMSKMDASRYCALNLLYQLFKDKMVDGYDADSLSKRQLLKSQLVYVVNIEQQLKECLSQAFNYCQSYNIYAEHLKKINPQLNQSTAADKKPSNSFLYWCPPLENYNPWTNSNLEGTVYAGKTKEEINLMLQNEFQNMIKSHKFQQVLGVRMKLPIWEHKEKVISLIEENPVAVIKGSTGCGKTTQVSQFILDSYIKAGNGANCNIIVTQPRRISAISIAERVAYERGETIKDGQNSVGYAVRFDQVYPRPYGSIMFCTTGHLLRRIQGGLKGVSHLIIDEVHERDINTDLLLVIIRDLIRLDLNIHVIIMSATLGVSHFQNYFECRTVFEISSHLFPVNEYFLEDTIEMIKWRPKSLSYIEGDVEISEVPECDKSLSFENPKRISPQTIDTLKRLKEGVICFELILALLEYINSLTVTGSILIFLPGWTAIFALLSYLKRHSIFGNEEKFLLIPLHSQLSHKENNRIFQYTSQRKIILSTNIAETSITIDDVVFVIDTCLIKRKVYCSKTNVTSYEVDWVSKSNIKQRKGRAGRVRSGYFFILCTKNRYDRLEEFKKPDILISSLVETSLLIKYLGFGSVQDFLQRALDPPHPKAVEEALHTLINIQALDDQYELTTLGGILAKMPIDPKIGRMVMQGILLNVAGPIVTIAAASSINYEMFDSSDLNLLLDTLSKLDEQRLSDHLITFKTYNLCENSMDYLKYRCINMNAVSVVRNARKQLVNILVKHGFNSSNFQLKKLHLYSSLEYDIISGLLVTAFYPNVCVHKETRKIMTNEERIGLIHKTSVFYSYLSSQKLPRATKLKSPLFVYSEKSQTNNLISSKQMTIVTFLHVLLFGTRTVQFPPNTDSNVTGTILVDGWIEIKIDAEVFEAIWQMKTEFDQLILRACADPNYSKTELDTTVVNAIIASCLFDKVTVDIVTK